MGVASVDMNCVCSSKFTDISGELLEFPVDGFRKFLRNPWQLFINIHELASE